MQKLALVGVLAGTLAFGGCFSLNDKSGNKKLEYECVGNVPSIYDFNDKIRDAHIEFKICDNTSYLISKREDRLPIVFIDDGNDLIVDGVMIGDGDVGTKHPFDFGVLMLAKASFEKYLNEILEYKNLR